MDFGDPSISWGRVKSQEFDSVYNSPGMSIVQADGVLGMGPNDDPDIKSVMTSMFEQKVIDRQQFAFFYSIDESAKPSSFTFGGYDKEIVAKSGEEINWLPRIGDVHWTSGLEGMRVGQASISTGGSQVLFDSGSSWIILFPMDFEVIYAAGMQNSYTCGSQDGMLWCEKDVTDSEFEFEKLPQIEFTLKGKAYGLDYKLLLAQCQVKNQSGRIIRGCLFKVRAMKFGIRVLGMPFLQQNYVIFDRDTQSIGIVPNPQEAALQPVMKAETHRIVHVAASATTKPAKRRGPSVFFFFSFITLTATLVIIAYYVVKTLLEDALSENSTLDDSNPNAIQNQISELAPINVRQEERLGLITSPVQAPTAPPQAGHSYNPYNPFNDSKMNRQNSDDSSAQYFSIGGGIGIPTVADDEEVRVGMVQAQ